jgi:hypothetical protein
LTLTVSQQSQEHTPSFTPSVCSRC